MAFHIACPLTCRRICYCLLGAPAAVQAEGGRRAFVENALELQKLLRNPLFLRAGGHEEVEVLVPRIRREQEKKEEVGSGKEGFSGEQQGVGDGVAEGEAARVADTAVMRRKVAVANIAAAEAAVKAEHAKKAADVARLEAARQVADAEALMKAEGMPFTAEVKDLSSGPSLRGAQTVCEICMSGETLGSRHAERMMSCSSCSRKFHRNCLKQWADDRDLFNWASWVCAACRSCEVCKVTGDPNKLMFCKRCDGAYHTHCQQPPLKHVVKGPFLCPNHTQCHSCNSNVPGSGISSRWFLNYIFCDACGRLFVKQNYCPVCLKVYRDTEPLPMVCCDKCEHWVHIGCDGISEERYEMFQHDGNLRYNCPACRGEIHKIKDTDDAVRELWRRRDRADVSKIAEAKAAARLPSQEELMMLCPSDNEKQEPPPERTQETLKKPSKKSKSRSKSRSSKSSRKHSELDGPDGEDGAAEPKRELTFKLKLPKVKMLSVNTDMTDSPGQRGKPVDGAVSSPAQTDDPGSPQQWGSTPLLKHKSRKYSATMGGVMLSESGKELFEDRDVDTLDEDDRAAVRGQRSKRKRREAGSTEKAEKVEITSKDRDVRSHRHHGAKERSVGDDCWILERLGRDAISKKIEVYWPSNDTWYRGTVAGVSPHKSQFTVLFDDGESQVLRYGIDKVRLLSGSRGS